MAKITAFLEPILRWLAISFFVVMVVSAFLQIFTRYVVNASLPWTDELARYTFIWSTMLGAALVHRKRGHIMIDLLVDRLVGQKQAVVKVGVDIFSLIILLVLVVQGTNMLQIGAMQITPTLEIPMSYVMLSVPVSAAYMCLVTIEHLIADIGAFKKSSAEVAQ